MVPNENRSVGRPGVPAEVWNQAVDMHLEGKSPKEICAATGLSQTKVYEVRRYPIKREAPCSDKRGG